MITSRFNRALLSLGIALSLTLGSFGQDPAQEEKILSTNVQSASYESVLESTIIENGQMISNEGNPSCQSCGSCADGCESCSPCDDPCSPWFFNGWLEQGFTGNPDSTGGTIGPAGTNGPLIFNDQANEYMLNQLYFSFGRKVERDACCWDVGGRVDVLYGTDYYFIQALGLETRDDGSQKWNSNNGPRNAGNAGLYGIAMPQFYVEGNIPWGTGVKVKAGHFYKLMGYESVMAPENFFYSRTYTMQYGQPFTHTGMIADWQSSPCLTWYGGVTRGWNSFEQPNGQVSYLGGVRWKSPQEETQFSFFVHSGSDDPTGDNNRSVYSLVFQQRLDCRWTFVLEHSLGAEENARLNTNNQLDTATWYGISSYLYYTHDPCLDLGIRFEWFDDRDNARVFGLSNDNVTSGGSYYDLTLGANYHPEPWFILRPELRWDWSDLVAPGVQGAFNNGTSNNQFTLGFDLITTF